MNPNNIFGNLSTEGVEQGKDVLGGFGPLESGIYDGVIKLAYAGKSDGGANFIAVTIAVDNNGQEREYRETLYVTNKQGLPFYEKDGKKQPLPGFTQANDLAMLTTGFGLQQQEFEEKVVKLYDRQAQAEVPAKVMVATGMLGKPVKVAILKAIESKTAKDASGNYVPTNETRETNSIDKVFHAETKKTVSEYARKVEDAEFHDQWAKKNTGTVRNKVKGTPGQAGAPGQPAPTGAGAPGAAGAGKSLFG